MSQVENVQETSAQRVCVKLSVLTIIIISLVTVQNRKRNKSSEKIDEKTKQNKKSASSSKRDLHDWDRFLGTILYPLSCGEISIKGEQVLRSYVTSVSIARNKSLNIPWKLIFRVENLCENLCYLK